MTDHDEDAVVERLLDEHGWMFDAANISAKGNVVKILQSLKPGDRLPGGLVCVPDKSTTHMQCAALEVFVEVVSEKYDYLDAELGEDGKERRRQWRLGSLQRDGREMDAVYRAMLAASSTDEREPHADGD